MKLYIERFALSWLLVDFLFIGIWIVALSRRKGEIDWEDFVSWLLSPISCVNDRIIGKILFASLGSCIVISEVD